MLYLYLPSCRALSLSASLCCFLQGIWRSLTLPSKSIVLAIHSPPIPLYLLSSSPSPHFFPPPVSSPPRISSLLIFLPYNPVCTILPLSPPLFLSYLITSPRASVFSSPVFFFFVILPFPFPSSSPATLSPPIFSQFSSSLPRHLPYYTLPFLLLLSPYLPLSNLHPFSNPCCLPISPPLHSLPLLPPSSTPPLLVSQPIPLIVSSRIRLSRSLRLPNTSPPIPASHFYVSLPPYLEHV